MSDEFTLEALSKVNSLVVPVNLLKPSSNFHEALSDPLRVDPEHEVQFPLSRRLANQCLAEAKEFVKAGEFDEARAISLCGLAYIAGLEAEFSEFHSLKALIAALPPIGLPARSTDPRWVPAFLRRFVRYWRSVEHQPIANHLRQRFVYSVQKAIA